MSVAKTGRTNPRRRYGISEHSNIGDSVRNFYQAIGKAHPPKTLCAYSDGKALSSASIEARGNIFKQQ